jgi:hypothetical protein
MRCEGAVKTRNKLSYAKRTTNTVFVKIFSADELVILNYFVQVERENNGFEARWCGNRVTQGGSRPHVIFARSEVHILKRFMQTVTKELSSVLVNKYTDLRSSHRRKSAA